jgi:hypothetical protein
MKQGRKKRGSKKKKAIIMSGRSQGNSSSSGGSYRASPRDRFAELDYSKDFFGNSRYAATGLYYDISGERRPVPSLEVESDALEIYIHLCVLVSSSDLFYKLIMNQILNSKTT